MNERDINLEIKGTYAMCTQIVNQLSINYNYLQINPINAIDFLLPNSSLAFPH